MSNVIVTQRDTQLERQRAGYIQLSLTNFTTIAEPQIAAGSVVEISGSLYSFTCNQSITGWAGMINGDVWIKLVPDALNPCTAEFTQTAPTWSDAKQGWYDSTGTDRYVATLKKNGASFYADKFVGIRLYETGTYVLSGGGSVTLEPGRWLLKLQAGSTDYSMIGTTIWGAPQLLATGNSSSAFSQLSISLISNGIDYLLESVGNTTTYYIHYKETKYGGRES